MFKTTLTFITRLEDVADVVDMPALGELVNKYDLLDIGNKNDTIVDGNTFASVVTRKWGSEELALSYKSEIEAMLGEIVTILVEPYEA
tara:strand:- start:746 stop:1009 length:264 start_codon:yes stop_codon:yes gene_type:complete